MERDAFDLSNYVGEISNTVLTLDIARGYAHNPCQGGVCMTHDGSRSDPTCSLYNHDGTYLVEFVCGLSAKYALAVTVGGEHVRGSPFSFVVPLEEANANANAPPGRPKGGP